MSARTAQPGKILSTEKSLAESKIPRNGLPVGAVAPTFSLPGLDGRQHSLADYHGRRVLLIFTDPECGPCNQLLGELIPLKYRPTYPEVLIISRGDPSANMAKFLQRPMPFPVVLQKHWEISREYALFATPIGYLINEEGVISAPVASGPAAILNLVTDGLYTLQSEVHSRLDELKNEFRCGQRELEEVENRRTYLRETLLRISGAIQVLEEVVAPDDAAAVMARGLGMRGSVGASIPDGSVSNG